MSAPRCIVLDGRAYVWRELVRLRRAQLAEHAKAKQRPLFELRDDSRPQTERTASGRYQAPSLFDSG
jgi:hypothetical protein